MRDRGRSRGVDAASKETDGLGPAQRIYTAPIACGTETCGRSRITLKIRSACSLFFTWAGGSSSYSKRLPSFTYVASLTMIWPVDAMPQRRADVLAVSPTTV